MCRHLVVGLLFALFLSLGLGGSRAADRDRYALLIGNALYGGPPNGTDTSRLRTLRNPCNDVNQVAAKLVRVGWAEDHVVVVCDLTVQGMENKIRDFAGQFNDADRPLGLIYFAGHGVQVGGANYLFGVDAHPDVARAAALARSNPEAALFVRDAVELGSRVVKLFGRLDKAGLLIVVDACLNDPLYDVPIDPNSPIRVTAPTPIPRPPGIVIEFSTQDGQTAADGAGSDSPFAIAAADTLRADTQIHDILAEIGTEVSEQTNYKQIPQTTGFFVQHKGEVWCLFGCTSSTLPGSDHGDLWHSAPRTRLASLDDSRGLLLKRAAADANSAQGHGAHSATSVIYERPVEAAGGAETAIRKGLTLDVFYCTGDDGTARRRLAAIDVAKGVALEATTNPALASYQPLDLVRVRPITPDPSALPATASNNNVVAFDSGSHDAQLWSKQVASIGFNIEPVADRDPTPNYIEAFICRGTPVVGITHRIYFQIADTTQESLARFGVSALQQIDTSAYVSDSIELVPESPNNSQVRFYTAADANAASAMAIALSKLLQLNIRPMRFDLPKPPVPGTLEVWIGKTVSTSTPDVIAQRQFWRASDVTYAVDALPQDLLKELGATRRK